ncbi:aromatic/alkene monooxygenase hydroxylase subunit beta [Paraburkholderia kururiensis]|uniref:Aromatic/alkene monooxygenase hydroxylase subunit beta n=1 Tax=Paraburkholderia kururiensis TaxID=984307 RepID=A0ABZ0WJU0_9BURK|nr:aromatic/alkene monooxygenase hydroxylase subunit beta [Paraburkholderia kururiensis]WQD77617.1 aromatic/alkene monooxygenase hydroxylase subunit beta [Paraburkholderia kururiensis]
MTQPEVLKPLKTWSHLATRRRKPSEYEIVSTNLHYTTDNPDAPFELDPNFGMAQWFKRYRNASPLTHADWNAFRDPDEIVYRTYNMLQDGQETYVFGLLDQFSARGHDTMLAPSWAGTLARLYTPARFLFHALQMGSAYLTQMAPASTISNCAAYQTADALRWLTHTAYRTKELSQTFGDVGLGTEERRYWEQDPAWQGWRKVVEEALTAWDWAENFVALNLVVRPAVEETVLRALGTAARHNGDTLLGLITDAHLLDAQRHRRWATALVRMALEQDGNHAVLTNWVSKWEPLADHAIDAWCAALPDAPDAAAAAKAATREFRRAMGL